MKVNGEVVSRGVNAISLHKVEGEWKITSIADTAPALPGSGVAGADGLDELELMRKNQGKE